MLPIYILVGFNKRNISLFLADANTHGLVHHALSDFRR